MSQVLSRGSQVRILDQTSNFLIHRRQGLRQGTGNGDRRIQGRESGTGEQRYPTVAADDTEGRYLVVWQDSRSGNDDVYGRRTTITETVGDAFVITDAAQNQQVPVVAVQLRSG